MIRSFYCDPYDTDIISDVTASGFFMEEWFFRCWSARMALETPGTDRYDKILLLDDRSSAQIQVVAPGDPSNGRSPGEAGDLLDFSLDFLYKRKGNSSTSFTNVKGIFEKCSNLSKILKKLLFLTSFF